MIFRLPHARAHHVSRKEYPHALACLVHRSRHGNYLGPEPQMGSHDLPSPCCRPHPHCPELPQHGPAVLRHALPARWPVLRAVDRPRLHRRGRGRHALLSRPHLPAPGRLHAADPRGLHRRPPRSPAGLIPPFSARRAEQGPVPGRKRGLAVHGAGPLPRNRPWTKAQGPGSAKKHRRSVHEQLVKLAVREAGAALEGVDLVLRVHDGVIRAEDQPFARVPPQDGAQGVVVDLLHAGGRVHPDVAVGQHVQRVLPLPEAPQMRGANPELRELVQNGGHLVGSGLIKGKK